MTRFGLALSMLCGALLLCACGALPQPAAPPALHDFGPRPVAWPSALPAAIAVDPVIAPSWLANTQIHYRLLYDEQTRLRAYAQNQWIAPPAELLRTRLQLAFDRSSPDSTRVPVMYTLRMELLDFEQIFETAGSARVRVRAVANLSSASGKQVPDPHLFEVIVAAPPDVQGAVQGGSRAAEQLLEQIVQWATRHVSRPGT